MRLTAKHIARLKIILHIVLFLPFLWLIYASYSGILSADPAKDIQHFTGRMALKLLIATLLVTPVARYGKQPLLIRIRRLLGLWTFAWATLHLVAYVLLELGATNLLLLGQEITTRPYLIIGLISWLILLALALTSTQRAQQKMGAGWQKLHNFIYIAAVLAPIHYLWSVKVMSPQPLLYAFAAFILLALRYKKFRRAWF